MSVYVIAQLKFIDRSAYNRYQGRFMSVLKQYDGCLLAADEQAMVLEGECSQDKVVVLSFSNEEMFRAWSNSREYQEILADRNAGANAVVLLAHGVS
jgi:uncharacterized protein (DUF1330 family)